MPHIAGLCWKRKLVSTDVAQLLTALRPFLSENDWSALSNLLEERDLTGLRLDSEGGGAVLRLVLGIPDLAEDEHRPLGEAALSESWRIPSPLPVESPSTATQPAKPSAWKPWYFLPARQVAPAQDFRRQHTYAYSEQEGALLLTNPPTEQHWPVEVRQHFSDANLREYLASVLPPKFDPRSLASTITELGPFFPFSAGILWWQMEMLREPPWPSLFHSPEEEVDPGDWNMREYALQVLAQGDFAHSLQLLEKVQWSLERDLMVQATRGMLLLYHAANAEEAARHFRLALRVATHPECRGLLLFHLGLAEFLRGNDTEALDNLEHAEEELGSWPVLAWLQAKVLLLSGREEAVLAVKRVLTGDLSAVLLLTHDPDLRAHQGVILGVLSELCTDLRQHLTKHLASFESVFSLTAMDEQGQSFLGKLRTALDKGRHLIEQGNLAHLGEGRKFLARIEEQVERHRHHVVRHHQVRHGRLPAGTKDVRVAARHDFYLVEAGLPHFFRPELGEAQPLSTVPPGFAYRTALFVDEDHRVLTQCERNGTNRFTLYDTAYSKVIPENAYLEGEVTALVRSPKSHRLAVRTGRNPSRIVIYEAGVLGVVAQISGPTPRNFDPRTYEEGLAWLSEEELILTWSDGWAVQHILKPEQRVEYQGRVHPGSVVADPSGHYLALMGVPRLQVFEARKARLVASPDLYQAYHLCFSPCGRYLAAGGAMTDAQAAPVFLCVVGAWGTWHEGRAHRTDLTALAFTPDGCNLFTADKDGYVRCWRTPGMQEAWHLRMGGPVRRLLVNPMGDRILIMSGREEPFEYSFVALGRSLATSQEAVRWRE